MLLIKTVGVVTLISLWARLWGSTLILDCNDYRGKICPLWVEHSLPEILNYIKSVKGAEEQHAFMSLAPDYG